MDILLIAPTSNLSYQADELRTVLQSGYYVKPLVGTVTVADLMTAMQRHYDIIWYAGHSDDSGWLLSDGKLTNSDISPLVANSRLVLLNSCSSITTASKMRDATSVDVIAHLGDVDDKSAFRFGATFIQNLKRHGENFKRAFDASVDPGDSNYVFMRAGRWSNMVDDLTRVMFELKTEIALLTQRVTMLESSIKNIPDRAPSDFLLKIMAFGIVAIAMFVAYGVYLLAR